MLQWEHSAILLTCIKLPFVIKIFILSNFEWPFKTGFTVSSRSVMPRMWAGMVNVRPVSNIRPGLKFDPKVVKSKTFKSFKEKIKQKPMHT